MRHLSIRRFEEVMIASAILQLAILAAFYLWAIQVVVQDINQIASIPKRASQVVQFDLSGAAAIDYHGQSL
ncbi:MAG: hypothetical protein HY978_05060 [Candidatus Liptonbacteria bacterium]|nr:hypothetical protein [Candidatus Liptonbacteria bacterium]